MLVGDVRYRIFNSRRQIGSYVGVTPSPFQDGPTSRDQGISEPETTKAHATMSRHGFGCGMSPPVLMSVRAVFGGPGRVKRVTMARRLLIALWRYLETGAVAEAPESKCCDATEVGSISK